MPEKTKGTCFVVMGFGKKTDFETGRTLDLDMSYQNISSPPWKQQDSNALGLMKSCTPG